MKTKKVVFTTGFALFSMFFGSGNLIFPLVVGKESVGHILPASVGFLLTGILVPFLGVFGMLLYDGNFTDFFRWLGKKGMFLFSLITLSLMGPFGALARCLTMMHASLQMVYPSISLPVASGLFCAVIYLLTVNKNSIVEILGKVLTPFLLISLAVVAFVGLQEHSSAISQPGFAMEAFKLGITHGYQTMDLLASFFFSAFVIEHIKKTSISQTTTLATFGQASLIAAGILATIYIVLIVLGWTHSPILSEVAPQAMLGTIATATLGSMGAICVGCVIFLACLTTVIVLAVLFADFLRKEVCLHKISKKVSLTLTLAMSFCVSTYEFSGIAAFLGPILETLYPALIVFTVINIAYKFRNKISKECLIEETLAN